MSLEVGHGWEANRVVLGKVGGVGAGERRRDGVYPSSISGSRI